jgi:YfiH family protein
MDLNFASEKTRHGFFGSQGGVSSGLYSSLNCGAGTKDNPDHIRENRARVAATLSVPSNQLLTLKQVHSAECLYVEKPWGEEHRPEADAMVTDRPGLGLGILTADCGPVLFYGQKSDGQPVVAAAHAGWSGALNGVLDNTVKAMRDCGAGNIRASVGPCIGPASYEVQNDFAEPFLRHDPESEHFFKSARREGHLMFDLPGYIAWRLADCGVERVTISGQDTYASENDFFSYRRATHRKESDYGRQISAIAINPLSESHP